MVEAPHAANRIGNCTANGHAVQSQCDALAKFTVAGESQLTRSGDEVAGVAAGIGGDRSDRGGRHGRPVTCRVRSAGADDAIDWRGGIGRDLPAAVGQHRRGVGLVGRAIAVAVNRDGHCGAHTEPCAGAGNEGCRRAHAGRRRNIEHGPGFVMHHVGGGAGAVDRGRVGVRIDGGGDGQRAIIEQ